MTAFGKSFAKNYIVGVVSIVVMWATGPQKHRIVLVVVVVVSIVVMWATGPQKHRIVLVVVVSFVVAVVAIIVVVAESHLNEGIICASH